MLSERLILFEISSHALRILSELPNQLLLSPHSGDDTYREELDSTTYSLARIDLLRKGCGFSSDNILRNHAPAYSYKNTYV